jgi:UDP-glucuronate decarboxylase
MIDKIIVEDIAAIKEGFEKENLREKCVLVTGGAGFIGSWLCDVLISLNSEVSCLDNLSTGKIDNVNHLFKEKLFKFIDEDVCTFKSDTKYDFILHLASHASPEEYVKNPVETLRTSSLGSHNILELARKSDATVLFTSTSEVYGDADVIPTPESYVGKVDPVGPRSCYYEGKRFAEALFLAYNREYELDVRIARVFNSYGPRIRSDGPYARAVPRFITQASANQPITVYGDGMQTRSFCYITDTITGLLSLLTNEKTRGDVVNIGNPEEITILELAQKIKQLTKSVSSTTFHPLPKDDPRRRNPDIRKIEKLLKWKPKISLDQGIRRTIRWFSTNNPERLDATAFS